MSTASPVNARDLLNAPRSPGRWALVLTLLLCLPATVILQFIMAGQLSPIGPLDMFRVQLSFTAEQFAASLDRWGAMGGFALTRYLPLSLVYVVAYVATEFALLSLLFTPKPRGMSSHDVVTRARVLDWYRGLRKASWWRRVPIWAGIADLAHHVCNALLLGSGVVEGGSLPFGLGMLSLPETAIAVIAMAGGILASIKWVLLAAILITIIVAIIIRYMLHLGVAVSGRRRKA